MLAMTRSLAVEPGEHGIAANVVAPGYTWTEITAHMLSEPRFADPRKAITALRRIGQPEDIAATGGYKLVPPV